jgi:hypothetical protein
MVVAEQHRGVPQSEIRGLLVKPIGIFVNNKDRVTKSGIQAKNEAIVRGAKGILSYLKDDNFEMTAQRYLARPQPLRLVTWANFVV